ncbi:MAG: creatininase family protein [bacterium]
MERRIDRMNWRDVKKAVRKIDKVILPVGTLEAHSITSNGTDTFIPERIAHKIAESIDSLILPAIPYGVTTSLLPYPGTVNISEKTLSETILDIALSCKNNSFKHFIILNGHGGNNSAIEGIKKEIFLKTGMFVYIVHWWVFAYPICKKIFKTDGGHGGVDETAMMLAIDPEMVREEHLKDKNQYFNMVDGISSVPAPAACLLYSKEGGKINLNKKLCLKYHDNVIIELSKTLSDMIDRIERNFT